MNDETKHSGPVDVLAVLGKMRSNAYCWDHYQEGAAYAADKSAEADEAIVAVAGLIEDANRWRAVTAVYSGFQTRGGKMVAYISTPQWLGDWSDFNNAIDSHFEINNAALANIRSAS